MNLIRPYYRDSDMVLLYSDTYDTVPDILKICSRNKLR